MRDGKLEDGRQEHIEHLIALIMHSKITKYSSSPYLYKILFWLFRSFLFSYGKLLGDGQLK